MSKCPPAFTLVEVVLATGIFALGVLSLIGLMATVLSPKTIAPPPGEWSEATKAIKETLHRSPLTDYERHRAAYLSGQSRTLYAYRLTAEERQLHWKVSDANQLLIDLEKQAAGAIALESGVYRFELALSPQHHDLKSPPLSYLILRADLAYSGPTSPDDAYRILLPATNLWLPLQTQSLIYSP